MGGNLQTPSSRSILDAIRAMLGSQHVEGFHLDDFINDAECCNFLIEEDIQQGEMIDEYNADNGGFDGVSEEYLCSEWGMVES